MIALGNQEEEGQATGFVREGSNFIRLRAYPKSQPEVD
jgi:hypothetical protein